MKKIIYFGIFSMIIYGFFNLIGFQKKTENMVFVKGVFSKWGMYSTKGNKLKS